MVGGKKANRIITIEAWLAGEVSESVSFPRLKRFEDLFVRERWRSTAKASGIQMSCSKMNGWNGPKPMKTGSVPSAHLAEGRLNGYREANRLRASSYLPAMNTTIALVAARSCCRRLWYRFPTVFCTGCIAKPMYDLSAGWNSGFVSSGLDLLLGDTLI